MQTVLLKEGPNNHWRRPFDVELPLDNSCYTHGDFEEQIVGKIILSSGQLATKISQNIVEKVLHAWNLEASTKTSITSLACTGSAVGKST